MSMWTSILTCVLGCVSLNSRTALGVNVIDIPSPLVNVTGCHRRVTVSYVCNQDEILADDAANRLDQLITNIYQVARCPCSVDQCRIDNMGFPIGIAVIRQMQLDSQTNGAASLDITLKAARTYATSILSRWQLGRRCSEGVLIFYSQQDNVYYTAVDTTASQVLTTDIVGEIASNARMAFSRNVTEGLTKLLQDYRDVFLGRYNRTTNWQSSGNEPRVAGVIGADACHHVTSANLFFLLTLMAVLVSSRSLIFS